MGLLRRLIPFSLVNLGLTLGVVQNLDVLLALTIHSVLGLKFLKLSTGHINLLFVKLSIVGLSHV